MPCPPSPRPSITPATDPAAAAPRRRRACTALAGLGALGSLALGGCDERNPHADDAIYLTPQESRDVFVTSNNLGPDTSVIVLANVPRARYENGAIVLTGGKELYVVQPNAWRVYTGTALSTEEADREISRADRLQAAIHDVGDAASDLKDYLGSRSAVAKDESDHLRAQDAAWKQEQEQQVESMLSEANRLQRSRDAEVDAIIRARDERIASIYAQSARDTQALTDAMASSVSELTNRSAGLEAAENVDEHQQEERQAKADELENDVSASKGDEYLRGLAEHHRQHREELEAAHEHRLEDIHSRRDAELQRLRADTATKIDDTRRLTEAKVEHVRHEADLQLSDIQARHDADPPPASPASVPPAGPPTPAAPGGTSATPPAAAASTTAAPGPGASDHGADHAP